MEQENIEQLGINTIRVLAADAVQKANSGHPGMPMGAAPMAHGHSIAGAGEAARTGNAAEYRRYGI